MLDIFFDCMPRPVTFLTAVRFSPRYTENDPFVMSMVFLACFLFGPLSMLYSWALLTRKRYTHVLGIVVGASTLLMQAIYLLTAYYSGGWTHFKFEGGYWGWRFLFFFSKVFFNIFIANLCIFYNIVKQTTHQYRFICEL